MGQSNDCHEAQAVMFLPLTSQNACEDVCETLVKGAETDSVGQRAGSPTHQPLKYGHPTQKLPNLSSFCKMGDHASTPPPVLLKGWGT